LVGLIAIKILAPGYYANQDIKTPVKIAVAVLIITQLLNIAFVPMFQHAGLALSISIGALINALWLLIGLIKRGSYQPLPGWGKFIAQVVFASALLGMLLWWSAAYFDWTALRSDIFKRIMLLAGVLVASAAIYFIALIASGVKIKTLLKGQG
jgi:putative peptidoglycan lipid II flippase